MSIDPVQSGEGQMQNLKSALAGNTWHAEPPEWTLEDDGLTLATGEKTDFWQGTLYGFRRDDGHFFGREIKGDFTAVVSFEAAYEVLYDQAGLMMRVDAKTWLKAGIEYSDGVTNFSTVVTRDGASDWSVVSRPGLSGIQRVRLTRVDGAAITHFLGPDGTWHLMRLANFPGDVPVTFGPMACSPERAGLKVRFHAVEIGPPIENPLHAP